MQQSIRERIYLAVREFVWRRYLKAVPYSRVEAFWLRLYFRFG